MERPQSFTLCGENITAVKRPGFSCTKCKKTIHRKCTKMLPGFEIWTCDECKKKKNNHRSSLTLTSLFQPLSASGGEGSGNNNNLEKEMEEIKRSNSLILDCLSSIGKKLQLLGDYREENVCLKTENRRLKVEIDQLRRELRICESKQMTLASSSTDRNPDISGDDPTPEENEPTSVSQSSLSPPTQCYAEDQINQESRMESDTISHALLSAMKPLKWLYVSNLNPETTCEDIKSYITSKMKIKRSETYCSSLTPKSIINPFYASFKVGVPDSCWKSIVLKSNWPCNVSIREFTNSNQERNFRPGLQGSSKT